MVRFRQECETNGFWVIAFIKGKICFCLSPGETVWGVGEERGMSHDTCETIITALRKGSN